MKILEQLRQEMVVSKEKMQTLINTGAEDWQVGFQAEKQNFARLQSEYDSRSDLEGLDIPEKQNLKSLPVDGGQADQKPDQLDPANGLAQHRAEYMVKAIRALRDKDLDSLKSLQLTNSASGGWLVAETMANEILPALKPELVFARLRTRQWPMVDDQLTFRKRGNRANVYWQGESKDIGKTDLRGGAFNLVAKYAAAILEISNRLLNSSQGTLVEQSIRLELVEELALALEDAYLFGVGAQPAGVGHTGAQPLGLSNQSGINVFKIGAAMDGLTGAAVNGASPTLTDYSRSMNMVERSNVRMTGTAAWIANPVIKGMLRELKDNDGRHYFWEAPQSSEKASTLGGFPIEFTNQIPTDVSYGTSNDTTYMFFGEWRHFYIGTPSDLGFATTSQSDGAFARNETHIRAIIKTDCIASYPEAFVRVEGIKTGL